MAKPRVFVSSTYYDLKHLRSSLENFIDSFGFEPVLSEKGDIAYTPDAPLDESCYREASGADVFVLVIGGRYGSEASSQEKKPNKAFYDRFDSITKEEYKHAILRNIPIYILIESNVYSEYRTFLKNKENKNIQYAHVDSVNIFYLIEDILSQPKNNPIFTFERYSEIENWLREQWAGLFKELLSRMTEQQQIATLASKITELGEINETLRRYMETLLSKLSSKKESETLIESESKRLEEARQLVRLEDNRWVRYVTRHLSLPADFCISAIRKAKSLDDFIDIIKQDTEAEKQTNEIERIRKMLQRENGEPLKDFNEARKILEVPPLKQ